MIRKSKKHELHYLTCQDQNCDLVACVGRRTYEAQITKLKKELAEARLETLGWLEAWKRTEAALDYIEGEIEKRKK